MGLPLPTQTGPVICQLRSKLNAGNHLGKFCRCYTFFMLFYLSQRTKFAFLPQNQFCLLLKRKKHKCFIKNISVWNADFPLFRNQNLSVDTSILVSKSAEYITVGCEKGGITIFKSSFLIYFRNYNP